MKSGAFLFHFICVYFIPLTMLVMGLKYWQSPPKYPGGSAVALYGYRSHMSMLSEDTWKTAHSCIGLLWAILGAVLLVFTYLCRHWMLVQNNFGFAALLLVFLQFIIMCVPPFLITEIRLRLLFDENGERKPAGPSS